MNLLVLIGCVLISDGELGLKLGDSGAEGPTHGGGGDADTDADSDADSSMCSGPSILDAHTGMGITQAEYDDFVALITGVVASDGVPEEVIATCVVPVLNDPALSSDIVGH